MKLLLHILILVLSGISNCNVYPPARNPWNYFGYTWPDTKPSIVFRKPMAAMVDLTNDLGVAILQDYSYSRGNFAFSPYGVASVLVVLYEGARGESARQIHRAVRFPWDRDITRIGFRDIHRHLRTYFSHEGYLSGITLSKQGSTLKPEYKRILRFYGYDVDVESPENTTDSLPPKTTEVSVPTTHVSSSSAPPATTEGTNAPDVTTGKGNVITSVTDAEAEETVNETSTLVFSQSTTPGYLDAGTTLLTKDEELVPVSAMTDMDTTTTNAEKTVVFTKNPNETTGLESTVKESSVLSLATDMTTTMSTTSVKDTSLNSSEQGVTNGSTLSMETEVTTPPLSVGSSVQGVQFSSSSTLPMETEIVTSTPSISEEETTVVSSSDESEMTTTEFLSTTLEIDFSHDVEMLTDASPLHVSVASAIMESNTTALVKEDKNDENVALDNGMLIPQASTNGLYSYYDQRSGIIYNIPESNVNGTGILPEIHLKGDSRKWEAKTLEEFLLQSNDLIHNNIENRNIRQIRNGLMKGNISRKRENLSNIGRTGRKGYRQINPIRDENPSLINMKTTVRVQTDTWRKRRKRSISEFLKIPAVPDLSLQLQNGMFDSHVAKDGDLYRALPKFLFLVDGAIDTPVPMMSYTNVFPFAYIPRLHSKALEFPLDDERYKLLIILPVERRGLRQLIYDLNSYPLREVIESLRPARVKAMVPTFMVEGFVILTPSLQKLGIWDVFDPRRADLSGMSSDPELYVRNVEQSVTVVIRNYVEILDIQTRTMAARHIDDNFIASHPFLYFVMDTTTNVALMAGQMLDPLNSRIY